MSLQSAPLGQLPNMSMPYSIPRYEKGPNLWEKALGALLVNAAGTAADKATANLMSSDNAAEFGQTPRTGFGRLLDPVVGDKEAAQLREQRYGREQQQSSQGFQAQESDLARMAAEHAAQESQAATAFNQGNAQDASLYERQLADIAAQDRLRQELAGQQDLARTKATLENQSPENVARTGLYKSQGSHYDSQAAFERHMLDMLSRSGKQPGAAPGGPILSDADRAAMGQLRAGGGQPSIANPAVDYTVGPTDIESFLAQGKSPDEIRAIVARQQAVNTRAQGMPLPEPGTTGVDPMILQRLLQELGMGQQQPSYMDLERGQF